MIWLRDSVAESVRVRIQLIVLGLMVATIIFFCVTAVRHQLGAHHVVVVEPAPTSLSVMPGSVDPAAQKIADMIDQRPEEWETSFYGIFDRQRDIMIFLDTDITKDPDTVNPFYPGNITVSVGKVDLDGFVPAKCSSCDDIFNDKIPTVDQVVVYQAALRWQKLLVADLVATHHGDQQKAIQQVMKAAP